MPILRSKSLREILFPQKTLSHSVERLNHLYHPMRVWMTLFFTSLIIGFFHKIGHVIALSLFVYGVILYLRTRAIALSLRFKRNAPVESTEMQSISLSYDVINTSAFSTEQILVQDRFLASQNAQIVLGFSERLKGSSAQTFNIRRICDAGMGEKKLGPIEAVVTDPVGLFEVRVEEPEVQPMKIFPKLEVIPEYPLSGSRESFLYGLYDVPTRGESVNFFGIREYTLGDSLRHISWKLSAKRGQLLVKEFEKNSNTNVSFFVNMDGREHTGRHAESTWEYIKDLLLALIGQQVSSGNGFQLISQKFFIPLGRGPEHAQTMGVRIFELNPETDTSNESLFKKYLTVLPRDGTLVYITPVLSDRILKHIDELAALRADGMSVRVILLDSASFVQGKIHWSTRGVLEAELHKSEEVIKTAMHEFRLKGISVSLLKLAGSIGSQLLKDPVIHSGVTRGG